MSKNEFDALLLKKLQEEAFEYNPQSWNQLSERLNNAMPAPSETDPFDAILAAKLQEESFEYNPKSWQQLAERLDNPESNPTVTPFPFRKWGIAIGSAAALLIVIGLAATFSNSDNETENVQSPVIVKSPATKQEVTPNTNIATQPQQGTVIAPSQNMAHQANMHHKSNTNPGITSILNPVLNTNNQVQKIIVPDDNKIETNQSPNNTLIANTQVQINQSNNTPNQEIISPVKRDDNSNFTAQNEMLQPWPIDKPYEHTSASKPKTNIAFAGGVNYGNINTGYTAGVSIKRKIGGDFFVDGTVAMMYNNNANNVAANNGPSVNQPSSTASKPAKGSSINSFSSPALDPIQKLYYVQMNPSFGYQIEDKVALSVGGDFQKMLNVTDEIVQPDNNNTKVFPTMDIGLTTKSEFTISPNLQAGLIYREGLNNLFKADAPYVNRRYLQVQFKYNIPLK